MFWNKVAFVVCSIAAGICFAAGLEARAAVCVVLALTNAVVIHVLTPKHE